jgi:hypothetical protein
MILLRSESPNCVARRFSMTQDMLLAAPFTLKVMGGSSGA